MEKVGKWKSGVFLVFFLLLFLALFLLIENMFQANHGPGLGNLTYSSAELWNPISVIKSREGHGKVFMSDGYLNVIWDKDGGGATTVGGMDVWDVSDPRNPVKVRTHDNTHTHKLREPHSLGLWNRDGQIILAAQSHEGAVFFDVTDVENLMPFLAEIDLPGIGAADYSGAWWVFLQAPFLYVAGVGQGLYVVNVSDPTRPLLVNQLPTGSLGGKSPASVFAVGNLLVLAENEGRGFTTMDISDPENPVFLQTRDGNSGYSHMFTAGYLLSSGGNGDPEKMYLHRISHDGAISRVGEAGSGLGNGGYGSYQDGYFISGFSQQVAKFTIDPPSQVGSGSSRVDQRDEDFGQVLGNLIWAGDDHAVGSALIPHQGAPDSSGAEVEWIHPADGAAGLALTTRVGASMSDEVSIGSLTPENFIVRPAGGSAISGQLSANMNNINFSPDSPLKALTTYEVEICDVQDPVGNAGECFHSTFTTGDGANRTPSRSTSVSPPTCSIGPFSPVEVNTRANYAAISTTNAPDTYLWDFGDGHTSGSQRTFGSSHVHTVPRRHIITLKVRNSAGSTNCTAVRIVHNALTSKAPVSSSSIINTGSDTYVVNPDNDTVTRIDDSNSKVWEVTVGDNPRSLAEAPNGDIWVSNQGSSNISVVTSEGSLSDTIPLPYGSAPYGIVFSPDDRMAYVTLSASGRLLRLDVSGKVRADLDVGPRPRGIAVTGDSTRIFVTRFISKFRETGAVGEVREVDSGSFTVTRTFNLAFDPGPDTESSGRGVPNYLSQVRISPDGQKAWIPSKKDNVARGLFRDGLELTFESRTRTILSQVDLVKNTELLANRIDFNDRDLAQAVIFTPVGDVFIAAIQGSNLLEVWDANTLTRISTVNVGRAPTGLVMKHDGSRLYVHNFLSRSVTVLDTSGLLDASVNEPSVVATVSTVAKEALPSDVLNGKQIFYNAADPRMSRDGYTSCASCHLDGGSDQMVWDFTQVGEGLRNTIDLTGRKGTNGGFVHQTSNFDEIQDFENDIRGGFGGTGLMSDADFNTGTRRDPLGDRKAGISQDLDDLAAYVTSLRSFPNSPHRNADGSLTSAGLAGKVVFANRGCAACHSGPDFTDDLKHDVGTQQPSSGLGIGISLDGVGFNTPTLKGLWLTAPYLHSGRAATLVEMLDDPTHMGETLAAQEKSDLEAYLLQIDDNETNRARKGSSLQEPKP